ncbi:serine protease easter-like isoform X2 [Eurosta solidaginis]|uniref:serine protease easter-like isoform X2 n=1 Tax=Eurosta solidaginis TaxID=178769 RepID=UPI00353062A4
MELFKITIYHLFVVSLCLSKINGYTTCKTPNGLTGDCRPIETCSSLLFLVTQPNRTLSQTNYLRSSQCGYANKHYLVCCPTAVAETTELIETTSTTAFPITTESCQILSYLGDCIPIETCSLLFDLAMKTDPTIEETSFLLQSKCRIVDKNIWVCCPKPKIQRELPIENSTTQRSALNSARTKETDATSLPTTPLKTESCQTPSGAYGDCVPTRNCSFLLNIALNKDLTNEETTFLQKSMCGSANKPIYVCCPETRIEVETPTTQRYAVVESEPKSAKIVAVTNTDPKHVIAEKNSTAIDKATLPAQCGRFNITMSYRIFGGNEAGIDEYSWTALLVYTNNDDELAFTCGGSLINNYYVLTAAHCVHDDELTEGWFLTAVRLGEWDHSTSEDCTNTINGQRVCADNHRDYDVNKIIIHSQYNLRTKANDIALLGLAKKVEYTQFISPICLPLALEQQMNAYDGSFADIAGWGVTEKQQSSQIKLKAKVKILGIAECQSRNLRKRCFRYRRNAVINIMNCKKLL